MSDRYRRGVHEVADGVHAYLQPDGSWGWSNAGLVSAGGAALLVDTLFDLRLTRAMLEELRRVVPGQGIGTVVNTHANGDHCWGNQLLAGAEIVASRAAAEEMARLPPSVLAGLMTQAPAMGRLGAFLQHAFSAFDFGDIELTLPTRTFDGELSLHVGGREVRLLEVGPAHTRGDVVVHVPDAGVVFTGDILFVGGHPIIWEGPVANWVAALDRILALDPTVVVPGHGPLSGRGEVEAMRRYLTWVAAQARERHDAGMSADDAAREIHAALPASDYAAWGDSERVAVNVRTAYRDLDGGEGDQVAMLSAMADLLPAL